MDNNKLYLPLLPFTNQGYSLKAIISPDEKYIISGSFDKTIRIWELESGEQIAVLNNKSNVRKLIFSPDGKYLIVGSYEDIRIWDLKQFKIIKILKGTGGYHGLINDIAISPDGTCLIAGLNDNIFEVWNLVNYELIQSRNFNEIYTSLCFSPDGKSYVYGTDEGLIQFFDTESHKLLFELNKRPTRGEFFSSENYEDEYEIDDEDEYLDYDDYDEELKARYVHISSLVFSNDGKKLFVGSKTGKLELWDMKSKSVVHSFIGHIHYVTSLILTQDERFLLSSSSDDTVKIWDLQQKTHVRTLVGPIGSYGHLTLFNNDKYLITSSPLLAIQIWDLINFKITKTIRGYENQIEEAVCSDDGQMIAVSTELREINVYNVNNHQLIYSDKIDTRINTMIFSSNDEYLYSNSNRGYVQHHIKYKKSIQINDFNMGSTNKIILIQNDKYIVTGSSDHLIKIFNSETNSLEYTSGDLSGDIFELASSIDDKFLAIGLTEGNVILWDNDKKEKYHDFKLNEYRISYLAFSKDSKYLKGRDRVNNEKFWLISEKKECTDLEEVKKLFPKEEFMLPLAETLLLPLTGVGEETTLDSLLKGPYFKIFLAEYLKKPQWIPVKDGYVLYDPENKEQLQVLKQIEDFLKTNTWRE